MENKEGIRFCVKTLIFLFLLGAKKNKYGKE